VCITPLSCCVVCVRGGGASHSSFLPSPLVVVCFMCVFICAILLLPLIICECVCVPPPQCQGYVGSLAGRRGKPLNLLLGTRSVSQYIVPFA
jgi:hypothetical protein